MATQRDKIIEKAREILKNETNGIRYSDLVRKISEKLPEVNVGSIHGTICDFKQEIDKEEVKDVLRPERGLYILKEYFEKTRTEESTSSSKERIKEEEFYKPFADYLRDELEECTNTITLGGSRFQDKWGTPDVIGTYIVKGFINPPREIISAEIKIDTNQLVVAFGQACSYKLFSHKVYLVIPSSTNGPDIKRVESLCLRFGIGLILFNRDNKENPDFRILTRAVSSEPDYFYLNKYLKFIPEQEINKLL